MKRSYLRRLMQVSLMACLALILTGCHWPENPVRTSLEIESTDLVLSIGESVTRSATTESKDYQFTYISSNPSVAMVNQNGKVTAMSEGEAIITVMMPETRIGWYAAASREYKVIVKKISAEALVSVDRSTPLTLVAKADGKITVTFKNGIILANDIHYTINDGAEQTIAKNTEGTYDINVKKNDVVQLYSKNISLGMSAAAGTRAGTRAIDEDAKYINVRTIMKTEIYGNVMSMLNGKDDIANLIDMEGEKNFYGLFEGAEDLVNHPERQLDLAVQALKEACYQDMFLDCKGIEKAPILLASTLKKSCYKEMFKGCSNLSSVTCLATDISAEECTKDWLSMAGTDVKVKSLTTLVDMTPNSDDGVPEGWIANKIIPVVAITLDKTKLNMTIGDADVTLTATVLPNSATDNTVTWSSSKPSVATVDATGKVHAVAEGEAIITAKASDKTATCKVTVSASSVATVITAPTATPVIYKGSSTPLVTAGVANGGTMMYRVTQDNTRPPTTGDFYENVPTAEECTNVGPYFVWYYVKGDANHEDSEISATGIEVVITIQPVGN